MSGTPAAPEQIAVDYPDRKTLDEIERALVEVYAEVEGLAWDLEKAVEEGDDGLASPALPRFGPDLYGWVAFTATSVTEQTQAINEMMERALAAARTLVTTTVIEREHQERLAAERRTVDA